jgi:hypothetical protein
MHVEIYDLVNVPGFVAFKQPEGVAQPVVTGELLAAIDGAVVEQQNRDDAMIEHNAATDSKLPASREA